jgi:hypothetical protein
LEDARLAPMTFLTGEKPSETKLNANNALKTSSVKRVQYLINPLALNEANIAKYKAVQQPHQAYIGRKGTPLLIVQADKAPIKDKVRPVGATNVMGWPARHLRVFFRVFVSACVSPTPSASLDAIDARRLSVFHSSRRRRARKKRTPVAIRVGHAAQPAT